MAELLGGDGGGVIGFRAVSGHTLEGWEEVKEGAGEEVHCGVGAEFQVVLKQLGKKDSTTKLKVGVSANIGGDYKSSLEIWSWNTIQ